MYQSEAQRRHCCTSIYNQQRSWPWTNRRHNCISLIVVFVQLFFCLQQQESITVNAGGAGNEQYLDTLACTSTPNIRNSGSIKRLLLSSFPNNTVTLKLSRWADYHLASSFLNFHCKLQVVAPRGFSIMAVVQGLNLRSRAEVGVRHGSAGSACRDYIMMEQADGVDTGLICGQVDSHDLAEQPGQLIGPRVFYEPKGMIEVTFSISDQHTPSEEATRRPIYLELIFTAYQECTSPLLVTQTVRRCSTMKYQSCIPSTLFCDGVINCGFRGGSEFGIDEKDCGKRLPASVRKFDENVENGENSLNKIHLPPIFLPKPTPTADVIGGADHRDLGGPFGAGRRHDHDEDLVHRISVPTENNVADIPLPITIAILSACSGAMAVLLLLFFCCCVGRRLERIRNRPASDPRSPAQGLELAVTHSTSGARNGDQSSAAIVISRTGSTTRKTTKEDLPPPYDAIFPGPPTVEKY